MLTLHVRIKPMVMLALVMLDSPETDSDVPMMTNAQTASTTVQPTQPVKTKLVALNAYANKVKNKNTVYKQKFNKHLHKFVTVSTTLSFKLGHKAV
jgi:hypothetical protein